MVEMLLSRARRVSYVRIWTSIYKFAQSTATEEKLTFKFKIGGYAVMINASQIEARTNRGKNQ